MLAAVQPYLNTFIEALAAAAASYLVLWLKHLAEKAHLSVKAEEFARLQTYAAQAIATVAEEAASRKLAQVPAMTANTKLARAVEIVTSALPSAAPAQVENTVHALLAPKAEGATVPKS